MDRNNAHDEMDDRQSPQHDPAQPDDHRSAADRREAMELRVTPSLDRRRGERRRIERMSSDI